MQLNDLMAKLGLERFDEDISIEAINTLQDANEREISFLDNPRYLESVKSTKAAAVFIKQKFADTLPSGVKAIVSEEPYLKMAEASKLFAKPLIGDVYIDATLGDNVTIQEKAHISSNVNIGDDVIILAGAYIGENVRIGKGTIIHPNVTVYNDTVIGEDVIINAGAVIGSDGFGFAHTAKGEHVKIYHSGHVEIENNVEIGANATIDRAVFGKTYIKQGAKIDNLVQVGHNCEIGEHSIIVAQVGLSGSSKLGRNVVMGGQSATSGHLEIGAFATIAARGGVTKSIEGNGKTYAGFPLMDHRQWMKLQAKMARLLK